MPTDDVQASLLVIVGAGGHGRVVADAAQAQGAWGAVVVTGRGESSHSGEFLPGIARVPMERAADPRAAVHVAIGDAAARAREAAAAGSRLATVLHPDASISRHARLGAGCFVAAQAVVGPQAVLGEGVIVNHGAVVDHDVQVGGWSHVAPGATLGGAARIGARVLVGAGARVLPGIAVADDVTLGAGAVVTALITGAGTYAGVPARRIR